MSETQATASIFPANYAKRISPREVIQAYEDTSLEPEQSVYIEGRRACALGAVTAADSAYDPASGKSGEDLIEEYLSERFGAAASEYQSGYECGFDDNKPAPPTMHLETGHWIDEVFARWYRDGYRDGVRARRVVFGTKS